MEVNHEELEREPITAAERFLDRRSYEIFDTNWETPDGFGTVDIIAVDEDTIVFIDVEATRGTDGFPDEESARGKREALAANRLAENVD